jgi:ribosomal protein L11 methyltransferase
MLFVAGVGGTFDVVDAPGDGSGDGSIELVIGRGAFGSGEHETTASCLEELARLPAVAGARVLDLGSGTGILAIAALKLGAAGATCVDLDSRAVASARRNCELNGVADRVRHVHGTLADVGHDTFDLVLANIYGDILLSEAEELVARLSSGGTMILSGILWEEAFDVERRYLALGCRLVRQRMLGEYCTMLFSR